MVVWYNSCAAKERQTIAKERMIEKILIAVDFSETSRAAIETGRSLASVLSAELHLLHVVAEPLHQPWAGYTPGAEFVDLLERYKVDARARLEAAVANDDRANGRVVVAIAWGDPSDEILRYADTHHVDMIVCGTHGRRGWDHMIMGSVAERIVRLAHCPVLTVHAKADQTGGARVVASASARCAT
jgi:nucleotide-binding universal stress UspA family protein